MSTDHNQRIGFERYGKNAHGREEQYTKNRDKNHLKEFRVKEAIKDLLATNKIKKVLTVIGGGKEAVVLLVEDINDDLVCAKVFKYFTSTIKKRLRGTKHIIANDMANLAAKQEYWNLYEMKDHIFVPKPRMLLNNIIIMDFINNGDDSTIPAPLLREVCFNRTEAEEMLYDSIDILADLFLKAHFIHGDYSEHNLMINQENGSLITMDVSQSVQYNRKTFIDTPVRIRIDHAIKYLEADLININRYFKQIYKRYIDPKEVCENIIKELPKNLQDFLREKTMEIYPSELVDSRILNGKEQYRSNLYYKRTRSIRQRPK